MCAPVHLWKSVLTPGISSVFPTVRLPKPQVAAMRPSPLPSGPPPWIPGLHFFLPKIKPYGILKKWIAYSSAGPFKSFQP